MDSGKKTIGIEERTKGFEEIAIALSKNEAVEEANRCLQCKDAKCVQGCPASVDCREFICLIKEGKLEEAKKEILLHNNAPGITGRVCQAYKQCESQCILAKTENAINISGLERFVADNAKEQKERLPALNGKKIAVVGAGPAGLTAAAELRKKGYFAVVIESEKEIGGLLVHAIPKYRLPDPITKNFLKEFNIDGIEIHKNKRVGKDFSLEDLRKEYDAVLVASGEKIAKQLSINGNSLEGVWYWDDFLEEFNGKTGKLKGKKVVVIGGGDTAIDCSRVAIRNKADVTIVYRKTRDFMPAQKKEIEEAMEEGVKLSFLLSPLEFTGDKKLKEAVFEKVQVDKEHFLMTRQQERLQADLVVVAAGQLQDDAILNGTEFEGQPLDPHGSRTKLDKVFVAGDLVNRNKTVIHAIRSAKEAAKEIDDFLNGRSIIPEGMTKI